MTSKLETKTSYSLCRLHSSLNLSQSSLASSISHLPDHLSFTGMIIEYEELQLVGWKKEILITISEGCIETLKVSMWVNHENPIGLRYRTKKDVYGQMIHLQDVQIRSFDYTNPRELQFYGEIRPTEPSQHTLLVLIASGISCSNFKHLQTPFKVHDVMSVIPSDSATSPTSGSYPTSARDLKLMQKIYGLVATFHYCISKKITFTEERNPFQRFINLILQYDPDQSDYRRRASERWIRSFEQQEEWFARRAKRTQIRRARATLND